MQWNLRHRIFASQLSDSLVVIYPLAVLVVRHCPLAVYKSYPPLLTASSANQGDVTLNKKIALFTKLMGAAIVYHAVC